MHTASLQQANATHPTEPAPWYLLDNSYTRTVIDGTHSKAHSMHPTLARATRFLGFTTLALLALFHSGCGQQAKTYNDLLCPSTPEPGEVSVAWLGTASLIISDGRTNLLVDPFITRPELGRVVFDTRIEPNKELIEQWLHKLGVTDAAGVFVTHSHFDHLLDAPTAAKATNAELWGSKSTLQAGIGGGVESAKLREAVLDEPMIFGDFQVRFLASVHGKVLLGKVPYPGTIDAPLVPPAHPSEYRVGQTYQIHIRHVPTSKTCLITSGPGWIPGVNSRPENRADVVFLGIGGLDKDGIDEYLDAVPMAAEADEIVLIHFDNATKPLSAEMGFLPRVRLKETAEAARKLGIHVRTLPIGEPQQLFKQTKHTRE